MAITIGWNSLFLQLHMICLRRQHSYGCFWQTWPLHVMWSYQMWTWAGPYNNGSSWLAEEGRLEVMTMTTMVGEVLDGDSGKDRQWSVLITRLMTCTSIPVVQRSANTNIKVECSTVLLVTKEVHCTTNQIAHTCDLHNVLKSLRTECAKWQNASRKFGSGVESSSVSWSASFWGNDLRRWILVTCIGERILL